jgi:hypothetical protein
MQSRLYTTRELAKRALPADLANLDCRKEGQSTRRFAGCRCKLTSADLMPWPFGSLTGSPDPVSHLLCALDTFRVLAVEFVSLSESLDTATPAGRIVFTVLGAVAELERSLIAKV